MRRTLPISLFAATLLACSSSSAPSPAGPVTDAGVETGTESFKHDVVLSMSLTVPPGKELHQCQFVQLPKGADLDVVRIAHQYTPGSHHFILYDTDLTSIPSDFTGQYDCTLGDEPVMTHTRGILYAGQSPKGENAFPAGVGLTMRGGGVVMFQTHYINPSRNDLAAKVDLGLDLAAPGTITQKAGFLIFYTPFIDLPAHGKATAGIRCNVPKDITLLNGITHYHQRGTGMNVFIDPSKAAPTSAPFYATNDWEHPPDYKGGATIKAGSVVRLGCAYDNSAGSEEIFQGPNAETSEMCVFGALYYPKAADDYFATCEVPSIVGTGSKACLDVASCVQACPPGEAPQRTWSGAKVGPCWERCVATGCDGAVDALLPLVFCIQKQCAAECAAGKCTDCATSKCASQFGDCAGQTCK